MTDISEDDLPFEAQSDTIVITPLPGGNVPNCSIILLTKKFDRNVHVKGKSFDYIAKATCTAFGILNDRAATPYKSYVAIENYLTIYHSNNVIFKIEVNTSINESSAEENKKLYKQAIDFFKQAKDETAGHLFRVLSYYNTVVNIGCSITESFSDPIPLDEEEEETDEDEDLPNFFN